MADSGLSARQIIAYKIGARARKFASEGCPIEGYEMLYGAIAEAKSGDPELLKLLESELVNYEKRLDKLDQLS